jgi:hypothetical protein
VFSPDSLRITLGRKLRQRRSNFANKNYPSRCIAQLPMHKFTEKALIVLKVLLATTLGGVFVRTLFDIRDRRPDLTLAALTLVTAAVFVWLRWF